VRESVLPEFGAIPVKEIKLNAKYGRWAFLNESNLTLRGLALSFKKRNTKMISRYKVIVAK
jgi:hypothetical protein